MSREPFLVPFLGSVVVLCFDVHWFVSILVLCPFLMGKRERERERELVALLCLS